MFTHIYTLHPKISRYYLQLCVLAILPATINLQLCVLAILPATINLQLCVLAILPATINLQLCVLALMYHPLEISSQITQWTHILRT
jgi:hypothetical protein